MTIQGDSSIGFKKETTYGTAVTVDRWLEYTSESLDYERSFYQGQGLRPGSRLARSARRVMTKDGGSGDIELEVPSRGLGTFLEALFGTAASTVVSGALYQQLFTLTKSDYLPSLTIQEGVPRLGAETIDAYTYKGCVNKSFELSMANADVLKLKSSWHLREVDTSVAYATPSYPANVELFSFVGASLVIGGSVVVPTGTVLASGGTVAGNIRDFSVSVDQKLDDNGWNMGTQGKRSRKGAVGIAEVKGKLTAEYDSTTLRDAVANQTPLALRADFQANTDITAGNKPTIQLTLPEIRFESELPKVSGPDVTTQSLDFTAFDGLVAAHAMYLAVRTADTAL